VAAIARSIVSPIRDPKSRVEKVKRQPLAPCTMTVDIGGAMERGLDRVTTREGAVFVAALAAVGVAVGLVWETTIGTLAADVEGYFPFLPPEAAAELQNAWANYEVFLDVGLSVQALVGLVVALWLVRLVVRIGAIRWFVGDGRGPIEAPLFTRRLAWTVVNLVAGTILYATAVVVGLVLLVVPGIFLAVALFFYNYEVIVEGENVVDALANSYALTAGDRLELFLLGLVFALLGAVVGLAGTPSLLPGRLLPAVVGATISSAFGVFALASAADAYRQLTTADEPAEADIAGDEFAAN